ncbi:protein giant-lens [Onthophagus taurus]|uniref:protein giant-lens n=1 Tax=Onthophagus taurus TaxID=166361 RepID=UPI000C208F90|nr:protein giant-lens [Onthophagus taurus]
MFSRILCVLLFVTLATASRVPVEVYQRKTVEHKPLHHHRKKIPDIRILYQIGDSEEDLPTCSSRAICSKVDLYDPPWLERQCRCPNGRQCSNSLTSDDGYTLTDRLRQYKMCEPVRKLPKCRYFHDVTWTLILTPKNATEQIVYCHCPKNSVTYLIKRHAFYSIDGTIIYEYSFACSPQSKMKCQRKAPCRLFTVRKKEELLDEVNINTLCQCPHGHRCPHHHTDYGIIPGKSYSESIRTFSGYCLPH